MKAALDRLRTLLVLGRISNLPTVWSNLLVGWLLAGEWTIRSGLPSLLVGASFLYVGGMYLNDFCDATFDQKYCQGRPIPSGKISRTAVGLLAISWCIVGLACLARFSLTTDGLALLLLASIAAYDFHHKNVSWAPLLMGFCRFLLYPLAASAAASQGILVAKIPDSGAYATFGGIEEFQAKILEISLGTIPMAVPLALYVAGITFLARGESRPRKPTRWALVLLLLPVAFAASTYANLNLPERPMPVTPVILICLLQISWMTWLLVPLWRKTNPSIGRVVSGLLAGIVLVDMIALIPLVGPLGIVLFPLFALALLLQRIVPAT